MSSHPINLAFRFLLEIAALLVLGLWGWQNGEGWVRLLLGIGIPATAALLWSTFRVPNDPGPAPVAIPGLLRLMLEFTLFFFAIWALYDLGFKIIGQIMIPLIFFHYVISYERVLSLASK